MGVRCALTRALRDPGRFRSVSAFAPIVSPLHCPWGAKALAGYLGPDRTAWRQYDACALIEDGARAPAIMVAPGLSAGFLQSQLHPQLLEAAGAAAGPAPTLPPPPGHHTPH